MIERTQFRAKTDAEELLPGTASLHCLYADEDSLIGGAFPWHWHPAFEIDYIEGCDMQFHFAGTSLIVPQGHAVFINSGEIHAYQSKGTSPCRITAFLFDPLFLAGSYQDVIYTRYVAPVMKTGPASLLISPEAEQHQSMLTSIKNMIQIASAEPPCYEIRLRSELGDFWCGFVDTIGQTCEFACPRNRDRERMKQMLDFIHANYGLRLSLNDIASSAFIGARECSRCFQRSIGCSPMDYLNDYRIQMSIRQLMTSDMNITEISECCGFSSISYFGKVFKQRTGRSPLQYRSAG